MSEAFRAWLSQELEQRNLSGREFARQLGLSQSLISQTLTGERKPSVNLCIKIAQAFGEAPEKVLRLAEIIPELPGPDDDPTLTELNELLKHLSPEQRREVLRYVRFIYRNED